MSDTQFVVPTGILNRIVLHVQGHKGAEQQRIIAAVEPLLQTECVKFEVNTDSRLACLLGQLCVESDEFCTTQEYASGEAYEGREDLGNTQPGDGVRFKGRGLIQLTGRDNYAKFAKACGVDVVAKPELVEAPLLALQASLWFWQSKHLNVLADDEDVRGITHRVNGGLTALARREAATERAFQALGYAA